MFKIRNKNGFQLFLRVSDIRICFGFRYSDFGFGLWAKPALCATAQIKTNMLSGWIQGFCYGPACIVLIPAAEARRPSLCVFLFWRAAGLRRRLCAKRRAFVPADRLETFTDDGDSLDACPEQSRRAAPGRFVLQAGTARQAVRFRRATCPPSHICNPLLNHAEKC